MNRKLQTPYRYGNGTKCSTNNNNTHHTQQALVNNRRMLFAIVVTSGIQNLHYLPAVISFVLRTSKHCRCMLSCTTTKFLYHHNANTLQCICTHTLIQLIFSCNPRDPTLGCAERITMHSTRMSSPYTHHLVG